MPAHEKYNYLRQCWRTRHWGDGAGFALRPIRLRAYRIKRWMRGRAPLALENGTSAPPPPPMSSVPPPFGAARRECPDGCAVNHLFDAVDAQLQGTFRLAGGRSLPFAALEEAKDPEDLHAWHRLYWAVRYAQAAAFGHTPAAEALFAGLDGWLRTNPGDAAAAAPYTTSERIASLVECLYWMAAAPPASERLSSGNGLAERCRRQIWQDAARLANTVERGLGIHNHVLNNARGLWLASAAVGESDQSRAWERLAFDLWDEYFPRLVREDGGFAEQSSHYHLLLARTALEYWLAARHRGHVMPAGFEDRIRSMFRLANELLRPDGSLPRFGDNSPDHTVADLWGLMAAAWHYGLLECPPRHAATTPLTFYYGAPSVRETETVSADAVRLYPSSGYAFLRNGAWGAELAIHGDPGIAPAAHGDCGRGSFELWWRGRILVREPGSVWSPSDARSRVYRGPAHQNVTSINGLGPAVSPEDWGQFAPWYQSAGGCWKIVSDRALQFRWNGFRRLGMDIVVERTWRLVRSGGLALEEFIRGASLRRVRYESRLCLGDAGWGPLHWDSGSGTGSLSWRDRNGVSADMTVRTPPGTTARIEPCRFLPEYGVEENGQTLVLRGCHALPFRWSVSWSFQ